MRHEKARNFTLSIFTVEYSYFCIKFIEIEKNYQQFLFYFILAWLKSENEIYLTRVLAVLCYALVLNTFLLFVFFRSRFRWLSDFVHWTECVKQINERIFFEEINAEVLNQISIVIFEFKIKKIKISFAC